MCHCLSLFSLSYRVPSRIIAIILSFPFHIQYHPLLVGVPCVHFWCIMVISWLKYYVLYQEWQAIPQVPLLSFIIFFEYVSYSAYSFFDLF